METMNPQEPVLRDDAERDIGAVVLLYLFTLGRRAQGYTKSKMAEEPGKVKEERQKGRRQNDTEQ